MDDGTHPWNDKVKQLKLDKTMLTRDCPVMLVFTMVLRSEVCTVQLPHPARDSIYGVPADEGFGVVSVAVCTSTRRLGNPDCRLKIQDSRLQAGRLDRVVSQREASAARTPGETRGG